MTIFEWRAAKINAKRQGIERSIAAIETTSEAKFITCRLSHLSGRLLIERLQLARALAKSLPIAMAMENKDYGLKYLSKLVI